METPRSSSNPTIELRREVRVSCRSCMQRDPTHMNDAMSANSLEQLQNISTKLPISFRRVRLLSVTSQRIETGGATVVAVGLLPDDRVFTHIFL
eukprot:IDg6256t1